jgi:hypothetical protein
MSDNENAVDVNEVVQEVQEAKEFDKLSPREALEKAISEKRDTSRLEEPKQEVKQEASPQVKQAVQADLEPPAEFSAAGKEAWRNKDFAGVQKEFKRIHDSRTAEITRAQQAERQAREEGKTYRELAKMAAPYIEARGAEGVTPEKAIMEALALINEFKKADPRTVKAELSKIGINLDEAGQANTDTTQISTLQERLERLEREKEAQDFRSTTQIFAQSINSLANLKTRTGEPVFPDFLDNSESGIQFARELGSLTKDERFQAGVLRRFPDADHVVLVREAYKYLGCRVSGEPVTVSKSTNPQQIEKARRAAASTPGGVVSRSAQSSLVGKLSGRAAIQKALEEIQGR